jgi:uncharacterized protein with HEPN domain
VRDDRERLLDILDAIERIERYAHQGREAFLQNEQLQIGSCTIYADYR